MNLIRRERERERLPEDGEGEEDWEEQRLHLWT